MGFATPDAALPLYPPRDAGQAPPPGRVLPASGLALSVRSTRFRSAIVSVGDSPASRAQAHPFSRHPACHWLTEWREPSNLRLAPRPATPGRRFAALLCHSATVSCPCLPPLPW